MLSPQGLTSKIKLCTFVQGFAMVILERWSESRKALTLFTITTCVSPMKQHRTGASFTNCNYIEPNHGTVPAD